MQQLNQKVFVKIGEESTQMTLFKDYSLVDNLAVWMLSAGCDRGLFEVFVGGTLIRSIDEIKNGDQVEIVPTLESQMDQREAVSEP